MTKVLQEMRHQALADWQACQAKGARAQHHLQRAHAECVLGQSLCDTAAAVRAMEVGPQSIMSGSCPGQQGVRHAMLEYLKLACMAGAGCMLAYTPPLGQAHHQSHVAPITLSLSRDSSKPISNSKNNTPNSLSFSRSSMSFVSLRQVRQHVKRTGWTMHGATKAPSHKVAAILAVMMVSLSCCAK